MSIRITSLQKQVTLQTPRWQLLEAGKTEFIKVLRPFAGRSIVVFDCGSNPEPEPYRLAQDIINFIGIGDNSARWRYGYKQWSRCGSGGGTSFGGNRISVSNAAGEDVKEAARALNSILNTLGIYTVSFPVTDRYGILERIMGTDSPDVMALRDQASAFLLIGSNPMFNVSGFGVPAKK